MNRLGTTNYFINDKCQLLNEDGSFISTFPEDIFMLHNQSLIGVAYEGCRVKKSSSQIFSLIKVSCKSSNSKLIEAEFAVLNSTRKILASGHPIHNSFEDYGVMLVVNKKDIFDTTGQLFAHSSSNLIIFTHDDFFLMFINGCWTVLIKNNYKMYSLPDKVAFYSYGDGAGVSSLDKYYQMIGKDTTYLVDPINNTIFIEGATKGTFRIDNFSSNKYFILKVHPDFGYGYEYIYDYYSGVLVYSIVPFSVVGNDDSEERFSSFYSNKRIPYKVFATYSEELKRRTYGIVNTNDYSIIVPPLYSLIDIVYDNNIHYFVVSDVERNKAGWHKNILYGVVNTQGRLVIPINYKHLEFYYGFFKCQMPDDSYVFYDKNMSIFSPTDIRGKKIIKMTVKIMSAHTHEPKILKLLVELESGQTYEYYFPL